MQPLIITLSVDDVSQQFFDALRKQPFPSERNFLNAHLTLFHALPYELLPDISKYLDSAARETAPFLMQVTGLRNLGKGVAYNIKSEELKRQHLNMQQKLLNHLTPQDRQKLNPHITVQNKVSTVEARALYDELNNQYFPTSITATGFALWKYMGGPWKKLSIYNFASII